MREEVKMKIEKYLSAMKKRCSCRKYTNKPIDSKYVKQLEDIIALFNKESGLNIKLVIGSGAELFNGFRKSYGLFVIEIGRASCRERV